MIHLTLSRDFAAFSFSRLLTLKRKILPLFTKKQLLETFGNKRNSPHGYIIVKPFQAEITLTVRATSEQNEIKITPGVTYFSNYEQCHTLGNILRITML